ncbi:MAG: hypothetical protein EA378_07880 [Phycisphaerales bacterium]|nr:MAG: hypothetical protein EA378_07880 [Phycisphaerales bacterium]
MPSLRARRSEPMLEALEPRIVLSTFSWTPEEVYMLELVNRARSDPQAEAVLLGLDLAADLTPGEIARLIPSQPLALNPSLTLASRAHSLDLAERAFFDHINPDGLDPTDRAQSAGYAGVAGENIAAGQESVAAVHRAWLESVGHRKNVLSLHETFTDAFYYHEFGAGFAFTDIAPYYDFYTQLFGYDGPNPARYVLGVVYDDLDGDGFYTIGEGAAEVRVRVIDAGDPNNVVGTYTTDAAGNYQIAVPDGVYRVLFTDLTTGDQTERTITVDGENVKVDALLEQFEGVADDHASAGEFASATTIDVNPATGEGHVTGALATYGNTDLFRFQSPGVGLVTIVTHRFAGDADLSVTLLGPHGLTLMPASVNLAGDTAELTFHVAPGAAYYVLVGTESGATTGEYTLAVAAPPQHAHHNPGDETLPGDPSSLRGDSDLLDRLVTVHVAPSGLPIAYVQAGDGSWSTVNLLNEVGGAPATGRAEAFFDARTNRVHVAAPTALGLMLYTRTDAGAWSVRNLTSEATAGGTPAHAIVDQLVVLRNPEGLVTLAGYDAQGAIVAYGQTDATHGQHLGAVWSHLDITRSQLTPNGLTQPSFVGDLIAYSTSWGGLNIAGLDALGAIHVVWWAPGLDHWTADNLSQITGAPAYVGGITAYLTDWDGINLAGLDTHGNLQVTWWVPGFGGEWVVSDLTDLFDGPALTGGNLASYVTPWGGLNVAGLDGDGRLHVYWWVPSFGGEWVVSELAIDSAPSFDDAIHAVTSPRGVFSVLGLSDGGDAMRYTWDPAGADVWAYERLGDLA